MLNEVQRETKLLLNEKMCFVIFLPKEIDVVVERYVRT